MSATQEEQRATVDILLLNLLNVKPGDTLHDVVTAAAYSMKKMRKFLKDKPPNDLGEYEHEGTKLKDLIDKDLLHRLGALYPRKVAHHLVPLHLGLRLHPH